MTPSNAFFRLRFMARLCKFIALLLAVLGLAASGWIFYVIFQSANYSYYNWQTLALEVALAMVIFLPTLFFSVILLVAGTALDNWSLQHLPQAQQYAQEQQIEIRSMSRS